MGCLVSTGSAFFEQSDLYPLVLKWSSTRLTSHQNMLEQFLIFSKGGLILFQAGQTKLSGEPVTQLVQTILLEVRLFVARFTFPEHNRNRIAA